MEFYNFLFGFLGFIIVIGLVMIMLAPYINRKAEEEKRSFR